MFISFEKNLVNIRVLLGFLEIFRRFGNVLFIFNKGIFMLNVSKVFLSFLRVFGDFGDILMLIKFFLGFIDICIL